VKLRRGGDPKGKPSRERRRPWRGRSPGEHRVPAVPEIWIAGATDPDSGEKALKPSRIATVNGRRARQTREGLRLELGEKL
jgi:hypothetical protein